jgi:hypothetical protein
MPKKTCTKQEQMTNVLLLGQFADFIADHWMAGYQHAYPITRHRAWNNWRARQTGQNAPWSCDSLAQAAERWCWTTLDDESSFADLATELQQAIIAGDEVRAERLCYRIYRWGGVARTPGDRSRTWIRQASEKGHLTAALQDAVDLLSPGSTQALSRFNDDDLLMTSATTKLYAAAATDGRIAIYDGRVGAALGLLARQFLEARRIDSLPEVLHFMWGAPQSPAQAAARTRDPSTPRHTFRQLPNGVRSHQVRAELSRRANVLFQAVTDRLAERDVQVDFLDLERALFMIGYCVR